MTKNIEILESEEYLQRLLSARRPGAEKYKAFYDHRVGAICTDPALMVVPVDDHLLHRGDGIFEVLKFIDRKLYQLTPHVERMKRSANVARLSPPCGWEALPDIILQVARAADTPHGLVRILLGRGPGGMGIDPTECPRPSLYLIAFASPPRPEEFFERGVTAFKTSIPAKQPFMAKVKSVNYLPNALMKLESIEKGFDYPVCFDEYGFVAEGSTENICMVDRSGALIVPELTHALAGTTLMRGLELIKDEVPVYFRKIVEEELYDAREVMFVGTTIDSLSVVRYNGKPIHDARPGPISRRMRELLVQDLQDNGIVL